MTSALWACAPERSNSSLTTLKLERPVAEVPEEDLQDALKNIASQQKTYKARGTTSKSKADDMVVIDFEGRLDGVAFEGGKGEKVDLVLGSNSFIPGFEDQLIGVKTGQELDVTVTFPEEYNEASLAGKEAVFAVTVHEVKAPEDVAIDDALAEKLGLKDLKDLEEKVGERISEEYAQLSRGHIKRSLLDKLDSAHDFELPETMVEAEFSQIWSQIENAERDEEDKDKSEDELKAEYRTIAERRVRLGLVLAEIGKAGEVEVPNEDLQREIINAARQFPGQEREVLEFYRTNPQAMAQIRAPIFEEKVVDHILEKASVTDKTVSKEELMKDPEGDDI